MNSSFDKKTILHIIETGGPGGAENVLINLSSGLDKERFNSIALLCKKGWLYDELVKHGIETYVFEEDSLWGLAFLARFIALVVKKKVAIIHAHEFLMSLYATVVGVLTARQIITTMHGKYYYWEKRRRRIAMRLISRFSQMVSVSEELRHFIAGKTGIPVKRIQTVYNGIDLQKYCKSVEIAPKKLQLGIKEGIKVICSVGNLYPVKGHTYLLKAIPKIVHEYPDVVFLFAGRGGEEKKLLLEAEHLGITDYVKFLGFRSDIADLLSISDIFVLPSLAESLPLSVLEAMAMGIPPIVTDVGGNREIIEDQKTGFIVPPANPEALSEKIILLLKDEELANRIREQARVAIIKKFSLEGMTAQYESLYLSLL